MSKGKILVGLILSVLSISFCIDDWEKINRKDFYFEYPKEWDLSEKGENNASFILFSQILKNTDDKFRENINLLIQDLKGKNIDLKEFTEISTAQISNALGKGAIVESKTVGDCQMIIYKGKQGNYNLKWKQLYWVKKEKAYILTFTSEEVAYDSYIITADKILNSFKLKI